jgi:hypothetical protein
LLSLAIAAIGLMLVDVHWRIYHIERKIDMTAENVALLYQNLNVNITGEHNEPTETDL